MNPHDEGPMAYSPGPYTPHVVPCPKCKAPAGYRCRHKATGRPMPGPHNERWNAAVELAEARARRNA